MQASDSVRPTPLPARGWRMGSAFDSFHYVLLFKTSALALLGHHNCIAQLWKSSVAGLPSSIVE